MGSSDSIGMKQRISNPTIRFFIGSNQCFLMRLWILISRQYLLFWEK